MKLWARNLNLKLIALALALVTWFAVRGRTIKESDWLECPVELSLPDNVVVQEGHARSVQIRMRGPIEKITDFHPRDWPLRIDAQPDINDALAGGATSATVRLQVARNDFRFPRRLSLIGYNPKTIQLRVQRLQRTVLPVEVTTFGDPAEGYEIVRDATRAMPSTVTLNLGAKEAAGIRAVMTTPVNVAGCTSTVHDKAYLLDPRSDRGERLGQSVEVVVAIAPDLRVKELTPVPIMLLKRPNDRSRVEIDPETITITVRGRKDLLASLGPEAATAYVAVGEEMTADFTYTLLPVVTIKSREVEVIVVPEVKVTIVSGNE